MSTNPRGGTFLWRLQQTQSRAAGWRPVVSILQRMYGWWRSVGWVVVCVLCGNKGHFEGNQQAVFPALGRLLRAHSADPKCSTTELCFLLRVGWVVVRLLGGRGRRWCAPAGGAHMPNWVRMAVHAVVPGCASYNYTSNKSTSVVFFRVFSAAQPRAVVVRAGHGRWAHGGTSKPQPCGHNGKNRGLGSGAPMPQAWPL